MELSWKKLFTALPATAANEGGAPFAPTPEPAAARESAPATVETDVVLGERAEGMRLHIQRVSERIAELDAIRRSFGDLVPPMHDFVREHERTRTELAQTEASLAAVNAAHAALAERHDSLIVTADGASRDLALTTGERDAQTRRADEAERDLGLVRAELAERENRVVALGDDVARARARAELADAQTKQASERHLDTADKLVTSETALAAARDAAKVHENEFASLKAAAEESAAQVQARGRRIAELDSQADQSRRSIAALEKAGEETRDVHARLVERHAALEQSASADKAELTARHDRLAARAAGFEGQLAQARKDLRARVEELRAKERALDAETAQVARLRHELAALNEAAISAKRRVADLEAADRAKAERVGALTKESDASKLSLVQREAEIAGLRQALTESVAALARLREERAQTEARALERFERERSERQIAEGALAAARREIGDLRRGIDDRKATAESDDQGRNAA